MKIHFLYFFIFLAGLISQMYFMLAGKLKRSDFGGILLALTVGFFVILPAKGEGVENYDLGLHLLGSCIVSAFLLVAVFRERLITFVGARTLIILNIITLFLIYNRFGFSWGLFGLLAIPSVITLVNGFTNIDKNFNWQVFFYSWFCIMVVIISIFYFSFGNLMKIFSLSEMDAKISYLNVFFSGAALFYIISNVWYVIGLIPYTGKNEKVVDLIIEIKKHKQLLAYGYLWEKDDFKGNLMIVIVLPIIIVTNYRFGFLDENLFIAFVLAALPIIKHKDSLKMTGDNIGDINAPIQTKEIYEEFGKYDKKIHVNALVGTIIILLSIFIMGLVFIAYLKNLHLQYL